MVGATLGSGPAGVLGVSLMATEGLARRGRSFGCFVGPAFGPWGGKALPKAVGPVWFMGLSWDWLGVALGSGPPGAGGPFCGPCCLSQSGRSTSKYGLVWWWMGYYRHQVRVISWLLHGRLHDGRGGLHGCLILCGFQCTSFCVTESVAMGAACCLRRDADDSLIAPVMSPQPWPTTGAIIGGATGAQAEWQSLAPPPLEPPVAARVAPLVPIMVRGVPLASDGVPLWVPRMEEQRMEPITAVAHLNGAIGMGRATPLPGGILRVETRAFPAGGGAAFPSAPAPAGEMLSPRTLAAALRAAASDSDEEPAVMGQQSAQGAAVRWQRCTHPSTCEALGIEVSKLYDRPTAAPPTTIPAAAAAEGSAAVPTAAAMPPAAAAEDTDTLFTAASMPPEVDGEMMGQAALPAAAGEGAAAGGDVARGGEAAPALSELTQRQVAEAITSAVHSGLPGLAWEETGKLVGSECWYQLPDYGFAWIVVNDKYFLTRRQDGVWL